MISFTIFFLLKKRKNILSNTCKGENSSFPLICSLSNSGLISKLRSYNTYTFKNVAILDCSYNLLLPSQRQQLHQAIANWYEENHQPLSEVYYLLANHCLRANNLDKAVHFMELAGEKALERFAS